ncbi:MAG TPA: ferredoxin reductase family protein [Desulfomonilaceae bacterium]|nr:ferredoxin reductase family protein [Desulfomonilaceae bacterium]
MISGLILVLGYFVIVVSPLLILLKLHVGTPNETIYEIARSLALSGFAILALQPVLVARLKWIERPFGMDIVSRFHKSMGVFATLLLISHPPLLVLGGGGLPLILSLDQPYYIWFGKIGISLLVIHTILSVFSPNLGLKFEQWRRIHYILAPFIIILVFVHSFETGDDLKLLPVQLLWVILLIVALAAYSYHKILKPAFLAREPYRVADVQQETHNVWTVKLVPPEGKPIYDYFPGQFQFITFQRDRDLPVEEHHWTISSSPTQKAFVTSTIKESGDFTSTIGLTKPGDTAIVQAPFGRFSHVFHPEDKDIVFLAGGIGITPFMSMLRYMRDTKSERNVILLYGNKYEADIVFRNELAEMEASHNPHLRVIHVLSNPESDWPGERGHVDREKLERLVGSITTRTFYVCGPPAMRIKLIDTLRSIGVPYERIRTEIFAL